MNDNIANFPDGLYSETQVQLPTRVLEVTTTTGDCGC